MTYPRDFLVAQPPQAVGSSQDELTRLLAQQNDVLRDILWNLQRQNADVLAYGVVKGTSQLDNTIKDLNSHEVTFQVGGKPVEIFSLFVFSSYDQTVTMSPLSLANALDGIPFVAGDTAVLPINVWSIYLRVATLSASQLVINGPADSTHGGFFVYGFTTPDFLRHPVDRY
jgi:hypothetical protein